MKKILVSLLLAAASSLTATAGNVPGPDDTISFRVSPQIAAYVAANTGDIETQTSIAVAVGAVRDSAAMPRIVITEQQVVNIFQAISRLPEGVSAEPNKALLYTLYPYMPTHPWLAARIMEVLERNTSIFNGMVEQGFGRIQRIGTSIRRN